MALHPNIKYSTTMILTVEKVRNTLIVLVSASVKLVTDSPRLFSRTAFESSRTMLSKTRCLCDFLPKFVFLIG